MEYKLTLRGKEQCKIFIEELKAKRKEILDAGIDTADETELPTIQDIENDINWQDVIENDYYNGWGVTDHYDSDYPLGLELGKDFIEVRPMSEFTYRCDVNKDEIIEAIINHEDYDTWGDVEYGNDERAVDYNICIDNTTEETVYCSAFYRLSVNKDGYWQHDGCQEWYEYEIDFSDENWELKLKEAAIKAYKALCGEEQ